MLSYILFQVYVLSTLNSSGLTSYVILHIFANVIHLLQLNNTPMLLILWPLRCFVSFFFDRTNAFEVGSQNLFSQWLENFIMLSYLIYSSYGMVVLYFNDHVGQLFIVCLVALVEAYMLFIKFYNFIVFKNSFSFMVELDHIVLMV